MSIAFSGRVAVVLPVDTANSKRELPEVALPTGDWSTISKLPNRSATGNAAFAWISNTAFGSSITFAKMLVPVVLAVHRFAYICAPDESTNEQPLNTPESILNRQLLRAQLPPPVTTATRSPWYIVVA
jgi:hypothetical protein